MVVRVHDSVSFPMTFPVHDRSLNVLFEITKYFTRGIFLIIAMKRNWISYCSTRSRIKHSLIFIKNVSNDTLLFLL